MTLHLSPELDQEYRLLAYLAREKEIAGTHLAKHGFSYQNAHGTHQPVREAAPREVGRRTRGLHLLSDHEVRNPSLSVGARAAEREECRLTCRRWNLACWILSDNPGISSDRLNEEMWNALERMRQADLVDEGSDEYNFSTYRLKDPVE